LAKLLSHPACVGEQREPLLKRFEELVLYDGKPVFLKPEATEGKKRKKPAGDQLPPRRFHNLHDAAAWIQQNWPDFDLETNCPVTWPRVVVDPKVRFVVANFDVSQLLRRFRPVCRMCWQESSIRSNRRQTGGTWHSTPWMMVGLKSPLGERK
jgi:hypothetical protein